MPLFGISIYSVSRKIMSREWTPVQAIDWLAAQGAEVIEMVPFGIDFIQDPALIDQCREAAAAHNLKIDNFSLNANFLQIDDSQYAAEIERVHAYIDVAAKLGVSTMRVDCASFRRPLETNTIENFARELPVIVSTYQNLCDYAAPHKITILLENHGFHVNGADRTALIFEAMKGYDFGGQLDCGNFTCVDEKPEEAIRMNVRYATTVHMKDFYIRPANRNPGDASQFSCSNSWFRSRGGSYLRGSILAQGDLDIHLIVSILKQSGFAGNIFIEYEGMEDCEYGTKVSFDNLKRIWNEV